MLLRLSAGLPHPGIDSRLLLGHYTVAQSFLVQLQQFRRVLQDLGQDSDYLDCDFLRFILLYSLIPGHCLKIDYDRFRSCRLEFTTIKMTQFICQSSGNYSLEGTILTIFGTENIVLN
jgi:hypothetical protein